MAAEVLELDGLALRIAAGQRNAHLRADLGAEIHRRLRSPTMERRIATPLETIRRTKFAKDAARLVKQLMEKFDAAALVIGLPLIWMDRRVPARRRPAPSCAVLRPLSARARLLG